MNRLCNLLTGLLAGAGTMYFSDPVLGKRRRSLFSDQFNHFLHKSRNAADTTLRDMQNRAYGTFAELRGCFSFDRGATDDKLVSRVRSTMGRYTSHPAAIKVEADDGTVTLSGPILGHEAEHLLKAVQSVRGVRNVVNHLEAHESSENIAALQGGRQRRREPVELNQAYWSPTTRAAVGGLGSILMLKCAIKRTPAAILLGTGGFFALLRSLTNLEGKRLFGMRGRRGIDVQKSIRIERPVEEVFRLLGEPKAYPRFSKLVSSVQDLGGGRIQKTMLGPGGIEITLTERITRRQPNEFIAKLSEPDSPLQYAIRMWFIPDGKSATRVHVQATYNPPGGAFAHAAARVAGWDFKSVLDQLMVEAKAHLERRDEPREHFEQSMVSPSIQRPAASARG
jgi:uncharacterized membrane protein